ncbi:MAG: hypothetical protein EOO75_02415 [Myxococcales bacterium]|nr:MAG: hypothetical protein EOO75_02415 [Myxococcales bacterium]
MVNATMTRGFVRPASVALVLLGLAWPATARADAPAGDARATDDARSRAEQILDADEVASRRWYYGWTLGFGALTAGNLAVGALAGSTSVREEAFLTAGTTAVGMVATLLTFSPSAFEPARIRALPRGTAGERAARQAAAEAAVARAATVERFTRSWLSRIGGLALNATAFSIRWFVFKHPIPALYNVPLSFAVGEARVWTMPRGALDATSTARLAPWFDRGGAGLSYGGAW